MFKALNYIRGYLLIKVSGDSIERFMNLCTGKDIILWNVIGQGDVCCMNISLSSFYKLKPIARKTKMHISIIERKGLPFFIQVIKDKKWFAFGLVMCFACNVFLSNFIWKIEIEGNEQITSQMLTEYLSDKELRPGRLKSKINISQLEKQIRNDFDNITWVSIKVFGCKLSVEIKEYENGYSAVDGSNLNKSNQLGTNIYSSEEGEILNIVVRKGVPKVKRGDTVKVGDLLVDGSVPINSDDGTVKDFHYVDSDADILIKYNKEYIVEIPYVYNKKIYTGREKVNRYVWNGEKKLDILFSCDYNVYDIISTNNRPFIFKLFNIPVYFCEDCYRQYQVYECRYTKEEINELLNKKLNSIMLSLDEKGVQIIEKNVKIETYDGGRRLVADFVLSEGTVYEREIVPAKEEDGVVNE